LCEIAFTDLIEKTILIGLTYYTADDEFIEQKQYWGTVIESNENRILVKLNDGKILGLPPDLSSTKIAPPGEYRLRSTGEVVVDPNYLMTWNINRPKEA
jgi:hypothetical protein